MWEGADPGAAATNVPSDHHSSHGDSNTHDNDPALPVSFENITQVDVARHFPDKERAGTHAAILTVAFPSEPQ